MNDILQGPPCRSPHAEASFDALKKYARDITAQAREGKLDLVPGRDEEIRRHHPGAVPAAPRTIPC